MFIALRFHAFFNANGALTLTVTQVIRSVCRLHLTLNNHKIYKEIYRFYVSSRPLCYSNIKETGFFKRHKVIDGIVLLTFLY